MSNKQHNALNEFQRDALNEFADILNQLDELSLRAMAIQREEFPNESNRCERYDVFNFGRSSNPYDVTFEKFVRDIEREIKEQQTIEEQENEMEFTHIFSNENPNIPGENSLLAGFRCRPICKSNGEASDVIVAIDADYREISIATGLSRETIVDMFSPANHGLDCDTPVIEAYKSQLIEIK